MLDVEGGRELVRESGSEDCAERQTGRQIDRQTYSKGGKEGA